MTDERSAPSGAVLVVGGGISGLTAALEAAEVGQDVFLVEKNPSLGGRVAQLNQYFPKLCPPSCGLEINYQRIKNNRKIRVHTMTEVKSVSGGPGNYQVTLTVNPRYVNSNCTCCNACVDACQDEVDNPFNFGMDKVKAIRKPHEHAFPARYVLDKDACSSASLDAIVGACKYDAVELDMQAKEITVDVASIIWATGWNPYDPNNLENLKFNSSQAIISNMMMERLASVNGPTGGKILRPGDNAEPASFAFVQCAGSRDENHLEYCSYICCMASMKQINYIRAQYPEAPITVFYIDLRTPGKYEKFREKLMADENITWIKGKVADIVAENDGSVTLIAEDAVTGNKAQAKVDLAVLATGMQPAISDQAKALGLTTDDNNFVVSQEEGMISAGCAKKASDVVTCAQSATAAAMKAIQASRR
ncbi:CoB--CoM heterodisulfide reductase iron-sulfur subunit A family protein [Desulfurivibrio dismutans]|uniref:CoB--CoM heterodisulfide reductase iron-sulfur subunit A family protein n=1 Tax=Desulfurivibrio dismutans TaxID=1398908 RepID=UPI0023D98534|nr:FAD-dependent oxidoreductase [Desulfurivibrio alkaliphilus]MDF1613440.1 FAD-dependent oxidoreductase [Desulfurivibrio alkaliphilus]